MRLIQPSAAHLGRSMTQVVTPTLELIDKAPASRHVLSEHSFK
jgi:hypothetical protein